MHRLDLFVPSEGTGPFPLLVWVHGGGWRMGDKADLESAELQTGQMKRALLQRGFAIASVNYRLLPDTRFPEPMQDVAAAVRYLRSNAAELRVDPERFAIGGESAGGHLATMVAYTPKDPALQGTLGRTDADASVKAVVAFYGIYDLRSRSADQKAACGGGKSGLESSHGRLIGADPDSPQGQPLAAAASPVTHVSAQSPPTLLFHGRRDCTTPPAQAEKLTAALDGAGVTNEVTYIDAAHADPRFYTDPALRAQLLTFLEANVKD